MTMRTRNSQLANIDSPQQQSKVGLGLTLESGGEELQEQQQALGGEMVTPNIPF
jgi:mitochondrial import receptor subunit TOM40